MAEEQRNFKFQVQLSNGNIVEQSFKEPLAEDKAVKILEKVLQDLNQAQKNTGLKPFVKVRAIDWSWFRPEHIIAVQMVEAEAGSVYEKRGITTL
jgi:hypothetical protein